jgi:hypothetical protein
MSRARTNSGRVIERAAMKAALDRCRALADQVERELLKKKPEDFQNLTVLADFQASLESAAEVLKRTVGSRKTVFKRLRR